MVIITVFHILEKIHKEKTPKSNIQMQKKNHQMGVTEMQTIQKRLVNLRTPQQEVQKINHTKKEIYFLKAHNIKELWDNFKWLNVCTMCAAEGEEREKTAHTQKTQKK